MSSGSPAGGGSRPPSSMGGSPSSRPGSQGEGNGNSGAPEPPNIRVSLQTLEVHREDGTVEDDFKTWAECVVMGVDELPDDGVWYAGEEVNLARTSVTNGNEGVAYNYARKSKGVALTEAGVTALVGSTLVVLVFKGGARDSGVDALIGAVTLPLAALHGTDRLKGTFPLEPPSTALYVPRGAHVAPHPYKGTLSVEVRPSAGLEEFMLGGRVLTLSGLKLTHLPASWQLDKMGVRGGSGAHAGETAPAVQPHAPPAAATAKAGKGGAGAHAAAPPPPATPLSPSALAALAEDPHTNPLRFVFTVNLPQGTGVPAAGDGGDSHPSSTFFRPWCVTSGRLKAVYKGMPKPLCAGELAVAASNALAAAAAAAAAATPHGKDGAKGATSPSSKHPSRPGSAASHAVGGAAAATAAAAVKGHKDGAAGATTPASTNATPHGQVVVEEEVVVSWEVHFATPLHAFLTGPSCDALRALISRGERLTLTVRPVMVGVVEEVSGVFWPQVSAGGGAGAGAAPTTPLSPAALSAALKIHKATRCAPPSGSGGGGGVDGAGLLLPRGAKVVGEEWGCRGSSPLDLDPLVAPGATVMSVGELPLSPAPTPSTQEQSAFTAALAERDAALAPTITAFHALVDAAAAAAAAGGGGKKGGVTSPAHHPPAATAAAAAKSAAASSKAGSAVKGGGKGGAVEAHPPPDTTPHPHPLSLTPTLLSFEVRLSCPLLPAPPTPDLPTADDLIKARAPPPAAPPPLSAPAEFRRMVGNACATIASEAAAAMAEAMGTGAGGGTASPDAIISTLKTKGVYDTLKASVTRSAQRIVREKFGGLPGSGDEPGPWGGRDMFVVRLMAYMMGHVHAALGGAVMEGSLPPPLAQEEGVGGGGETEEEDGGGQGGKESGDSYFNYPSSSASAAAPGAFSLPLPVAPVVSENSAYSSSSSTSPAQELPLARLLRIAQESEFVGCFERASRVYLTRVELAETAAASGKGGVGGYDPTPWLDFSQFCMRRGGLVGGSEGGSSSGWWAKADTALREALAIDTACVPALLALAALQLCRGHSRGLEEGEVFSRSAVSALLERVRGEGGGYGAGFVSCAANTLPLAHAMHALACELKGREATPSGGGGGAGAVAASSAFLASSTSLLEGVKALGSLYTFLGSSTEDTARAATPGALYLILSRYLLDLNCHVLARVTLESASSSLLDTDAPRCQRSDAGVLRVRRYGAATGVLGVRERWDYANSSSAAAAAAAGGGGGVVAQLGGILTPSPLSPPPSASTRVGDGAAALSRGGVAYDGAIVTAAEAKRVAAEAVTLSELSWEGWELGGVLYAGGSMGGGVAAPPPHPSGTDTPFQLGGAPECGDVEGEDLEVARLRYASAIGCYHPPLHTGYWGVVVRGGGSGSSGSSAPSPPGFTALPLNFPVPTASAPYAPPPNRPPPPRADSPFASHSGVGGGNLGSPPGDACLTRLYLKLGALQLHGAGGAPPGSSQAHTLILAARDSFGRAVGAGRASGERGPKGVTPGAWALAWLGLGRALWASEESDREAEQAFEEANACDNGSAEVWGWLAYVCMCAGDRIQGLKRDREASAALEQGLREGLSGNSTDTVVLLHSIADKYRSSGDSVTALGVLRRAVLHASNPISASHFHAILQAQISMGEVVEESGAPPEECEALYASIGGVGGGGGQNYWQNIRACSAVLQGIGQCCEEARGRLENVRAKLGGKRGF